MSAAEKHYLPRVLDPLLSEILERQGGVLIEGMRGCGKTETGLRRANSSVFIDDPESRALVQIRPEIVLKGQYPRLIDEWQLEPSLWNAARRKIDASSCKGLFIFTGSSHPADDLTRHTGAARFARLKMSTMTPWERRAVPGGISLATLFDGASFDPILKKVDYRDLVDLVMHGGLPADASLSTTAAAANLRDYLEETVHTEVLNQGGADPRTVKRLIRSLARNSGARVGAVTLSKDVEDDVHSSMSPSTVSRALETLERIFLLERQPAWQPRLRSKARLRTKDALHLADTGLAAAALGASARSLEKDPETMGFLFKSAVFHSLKVYTRALSGTVLGYRDSNQLEVDQILELADGRWAAIEVKLGGRHTLKALSSLRRFVETIDTRHVGLPEFCAVISGTDLGYSLPTDHEYAVPGVPTHVIPFSALQP